jgi:rhomboid family GlyGly-CTERM serine protease
MSIDHDTTARRLPLVTTVIALLAVVVSASPPASMSLQFDREAVLRGELWRVITCHVTHWTFDHFTWDVLTFALLGVIAEATGRRRFAACLVLSGVTVPLPVSWAHPELETYRGLSGIDSALFALVLADLFRRGVVGRVLATAAGLALASKIGFEWATGQTVFVDTGAEAPFAPVPIAHAAGAAMGLIAGANGFFRRPLNVWRAPMAPPLTDRRADAVWSVVHFKSR